MNPPNSAFHPTRWTLVLCTRGDGGEAKAALSDLCAACFEPVIEIMRIDAGSSNTPGYLYV